MARKSLKAKEPVRLRFKQLNNGNKSIYLDIYQDGKRTYDFLKLYLVPERTAADRTRNEQTMRAANTIKAQRIIELANGTAGIAPKQGAKILLTDWVRKCRNEKHQVSTINSLMATCRALEQFAPRARLSDIDRDFCLRFMHFLQNDCRVYDNAKNDLISVRTAQQYYSIFVSTMNAAVRSGLITRNPNASIAANERIKASEVQRCYLTQEELQGIIEAEPKSTGAANTKQAFLFSCFCGLRISDIKRLRWCDIKEADGQKRIEIVMQKTQEALYTPLSQQALAYLPARGNKTDTDNVFGNLATDMRLNVHMLQLAAAAGINKHVTFHTARHTFATLLLTKGADIYTTSKLLGHTNITTTQIYAKIVDAKKQEAVNLLDKIFNN